LAPCGDVCFERREEVAVPGAISIATADFDDDLIEDVVVASDRGVHAYFGSAAEPGRPEGLLAAASTIVDTDRIGAAIAGDLDGDGDGDVGVLGYRNDPEFDPPEYAAVYGDGAGGFAAPQVLGQWIMPGRSFPTGLAAGDLDGNGDLEAVVTDYNNVIIDPFLFSQVQTFGDDPSDAFAHRIVGVQLDRVVAGDIDGDGFDDVATAVGTHFYVLRSDGTDSSALGLTARSSSSMFPATSAE
jgi:hypothetical protein